MIVLITGASHTGKTLLAQKLLEKYKFPYLSIDLLKMGLIRSKNTDLTPSDDDNLEEYLWPIVKEMIKTAIENKQNLVVEGSYIPFGWEDSFENGYRKDICYYCLVMSRNYIENYYSDIRYHASEIEERYDESSYTKDFFIKQNSYYLDMCKKYKYNYILIDQSYSVEVELPKVN